MEKPIIEISHLTKQFRLMNRRYGLRSIVLHLFDYLHDLRHPRMFTALDDVSFTVQRGERIGLTGPNGCGKTTLLSVIGGVYHAYHGIVSVRGGVSMMLALGAGMHPELSGRENIILNGVLQGKTRRRMLELMDDIIDFADIGEFIDAPLYQYSSGMKARLGFGVITAIEPEILLVDEVLAVGDAEFKKKCEKRIAGLLSKGCTLFLVSHNLNDIRKNCERVIRLDHGRIVADGLVSEVIPAEVAPVKTTP